MGTYTLTITGTNGSLSHSTTVTLVVATPDFSISATPGSQTVVSGNNATYTTTISPLLGFTDTVNLSVSGLPTGATATFNPTSVAGSGTSSLTVSTATTATGTYTLTITGTSGSFSHSTTVTLVVSTTSGGLPAGWTDQDVGSVALGGSASYSNGTFTVNGAGSSISGTADQFNYAYQDAGTSYTITARVVSMTNTNTGAQAGVMIRETLDAGSTMANINVTPANGVTWSIARPPAAPRPEAEPPDSWHLIGFASCAAVAPSPVTSHLTGWTGPGRARSAYRWRAMGTSDWWSAAGTAPSYLRRLR